jgi:DNA-binding PucR family transcriptional regulator
MTVAVDPPVAVRVPAGDEAALRGQMSSLRALLFLSMLMAESEEAQVLHLATTAVPSMAACQVAGLHVDGSWSLTAFGCTDPAVRRQIAGSLTSPGGQLSIEGEPWAWAYPLRTISGYIGHLIVRAESPPTETEQFFLRALVQQMGAILGSARAHARERATAEELRKTVLALEQTVGALESRMEIHDRLTRVAVDGGGQEGIARTVHEVTGYPVAIEDRFGNLWAWAGPHRPDPYPKDPPARREQMLRRAIREGRPTRDGGRLVVVARPRDDTVGVLALIDPAATAGNQELVALEHGATVLAMELARLRSLAETEMRVRRDLVEELLSGTDDESALARAQALGYDLQRDHRVVVVEGRGRTNDDEMFFHAVRRAARDHRAGSLIVARGESVVVLADSEPPWNQFRERILAELGRGRCRVGVGGLCRTAADFPRSYREAQLALKMQCTPHSKEGVTIFDDLGVYRVLGELGDTATAPVMERFVREWLGPLIDYDAQKGSELVTTLGRYFECGGNYDATSEALAVGRSTFKYRLRRIREILGHDLSDPETNFNLQLATRAWSVSKALRG